VRTVWHTTTGPKRVLRDIQVAGNKVTKKEVILREIKIKPGDFYDPRKVKFINLETLRLSGNFTPKSQMHK
jgi:outer membrane protein assembly factor BamA